MDDQPKGPTWQTSWELAGQATQARLSCGFKARLQSPTESPAMRAWFWAKTFPQDPSGPTWVSKQDTEKGKPLAVFLQLTSNPSLKGTCPHRMRPTSCRTAGVKVLGRAQPGPAGLIPPRELRAPGGVRLTVLPHTPHEGEMLQDA